MNEDDLIPKERTRVGGGGGGGGWGGGGGVGEVALSKTPVGSTMV